MEPIEQVERGYWQACVKTVLTKYHGEIDPDNPDPAQLLEIVVREGNLLMNPGSSLMLDLLIGAGGVPYNNVNAHIAVGDGGYVSLSGTVAVTQLSATVTGTGTAFTTELAVGDYIRMPGGDGRLYRILSIASATSLTLAIGYQGTSASGLSAQRANVALTDLTGANKTRKGMDAGFPTRTAQKVTWRATFSTTEGNHHWNEWGVINAAVGGTLLNRKIESLGMKPDTQSWQFTVEIEQRPGPDVVTP